MKFKQFDSYFSVIYSQNKIEKYEKVHWKAKKVVRMLKNCKWLETRFCDSERKSEMIRLRKFWILDTPCPNIFMVSAQNPRPSCPSKDIYEWYYVKVEKLSIKPRKINYLSFCLLTESGAQIFLYRHHKYPLKRNY